jgi:hypothetical protein
MSKVVIKYFINSIHIIIVAFFVSSCSSRFNQEQLEFDHLVLFVNDSSLIDSLNLYLTQAEQLSTEHKHQGTVGHYYLFYNTFLELLYLKDSSAAAKNIDRFGSNYLLRWHNKVKYCPVAIGLVSKVEDNTSFKDFEAYKSLDASADEYYLMSKYNYLIDEPMVYTSMPQRAYQSIDNLNEIEDRPKEIRDDLRRFLTHRSGAKNVTNVVLESPINYIKNGNINLLKNGNFIGVRHANQMNLRIQFDHGKAEKRRFKINKYAYLTLEF